MLWDAPNIIRFYLNYWALYISLFEWWLALKRTDTCNFLKKSLNKILICLRTQPGHVPHVCNVVCVVKLLQRSARTIQTLYIMFVNVHREGLNKLVYYIHNRANWSAFAFAVKLFIRCALVHLKNKVDHSKGQWHRRFLISSDNMFDLVALEDSQRCNIIIHA